MSERVDHTVETKPERAVTPLNGPDHMRLVRSVLGTQRHDPRSAIGRVLAKVFAQQDAKGQQE